MKSSQKANVFLKVTIYQDRYWGAGARSRDFLQGDGVGAFKPYLVGAEAGVGKSSKKGSQEPALFRGNWSREPVLF